MNVPDYELLFPPGYDSEEGIWESKGYVVVQIVTLARPSRRFTIDVRDPIRLQQDVKAEFDLGRAAFSEPNLVVVPRVARVSILAAIGELARRNFETLVPE